jgi:hypothetical protein
MDRQSILEIIGVIVWCVGCLMLYRRFVLGRTDKILRNWATENHFELVHFERCFYAGGFDARAISNNQIVYFVRVRDQQQSERSGWVCVGNFNLPFGKQTEVKWKDSQ